MFRNRELKVTMEKVDKDKNPEATVCCHKSFEEKTEIVLHALEGVGRKVMLGIVIYVLLDTHRQVSVAKVECNSR